MCYDHCTIRFSATMLHCNPGYHFIFSMVYHKRQAWDYKVYLTLQAQQFRVCPYHTEITMHTLMREMCGRACGRRLFTRALSMDTRHQKARLTSPIVGSSTEIVAQFNHGWYVHFGLQHSFWLRGLGGMSSGRISVGSRMPAASRILKWRTQYGNCGPIVCNTCQRSSLWLSMV